MIHSVTLDKDRCKGCTTCIKRCPTEAIRVRRGKATILSERCIDCGECVRACPHRAKRAVCDPWSRLSDFEYNIALPAPSLYGQFHNMDDAGIVLGGLVKAGFDEVYEVARAAETISDRMRQSRGSESALPVISSACPACTRLILQRFPKLIRHIDPCVAPAELAAIRARALAVKKTGLPGGKIGVFFITPCPAKMTAAHNPVGLPAPVIDGAFSMSDVYLRLLPAMKKVETPLPVTAGLMGIGWSVSGGEGKALLSGRYISVDGIPNVISVLEDIEDGKLEGIEFVEIGACTQGCLGGCLTVENPFVAKARIRNLQKYMPVSQNSYSPKEDGDDITRPLPLEFTPAWQLDSSLEAAMAKHRQIEALTERLPGLDCSSCGTPSCRALAEDVTLGFASEEDCIFHMREHMALSEGPPGDNFLPPPFRRSIEG
ncbi:MAG: 4Fe-4S binding protein [Oscillospiraceae bacterium]|jgi:Fe-S-cluster-containing hydrogenase component 2|nr:4Fe-4S binding protein [Oscillospiraceae bacterium]